MTSPATATPDSAYGVDDGYKWRVLFSVIFGTFMSILDNTVVNVALATLQKDFGASISHVQGIVTYYALSLGIVIPVAARIASASNASMSAR
jgi:DHA2 family multidrug resistance protein